MDVHNKLRTESHQVPRGREESEWEGQGDQWVGEIPLGRVRGSVGGGIPLRRVSGGEFPHRGRSQNWGPKQGGSTHFQLNQDLISLPSPSPLHQDVTGRFNERLILSLASCHHCLMMDDELNVLPTSSLIKYIEPVRGWGLKAAIYPNRQPRLHLHTHPHCSHIFDAQVPLNPDRTPVDNPGRASSHLIIIPHMFTPRCL